MSKINQLMNNYEFSARNDFLCVHVLRIDTHYVMFIHSCDRNYWYNLIAKVDGGFFAHDCSKVELQTCVDAGAVAAAARNSMTSGDWRNNGRVIIMKRDVGVRLTHEPKHRPGTPDARGAVSPLYANALANIFNKYENKINNKEGQNEHGLTSRNDQLIGHCNKMQQIAMLVWCVG